MPSVALAEIDHLPAGLLEAIVMYRSYRDLKAELEQLEAAKNSEGANDKRFDLVNEIRFFLARERRRSRTA